MAAYVLVDTSTYKEKKFSAEVVHKVLQVLCCKNFTAPHGQSGCIFFSDLVGHARLCVLRPLSTTG